MAIRTVIVDDEKPSREELKYLIKKFPEFEILGEFDNAFDALSFISSSPLDVVFFDVNMSGFDGIKLAETLKETDNSPLIVFITAYSEYALKAFDVNALDYVLKPVDESRFLKTVAKIKEKLKYSNINAPNFILCEFRGEIILFKPIEVHYFYVENAQLFAKKKDESLQVKGATISDLEEKLESQGFLRINKGYLVNLNKVSKIIPMFKGRYIVQMENGDKLPISPHRQKEFRSKLKL